MLAELPERDARGVQRDIYEQIKVLCGIPYVSSMQRHLLPVLVGSSGHGNSCRPCSSTVRLRKRRGTQQPRR